MPQRPALAIKIDNYPASRPHWGIDQADVVFEEPIEGAITRLVAVFQCKTSPIVGSIRSARAVDALILDELSKPIFLHVGGIAPVIALINGANDFNDDLIDRPAIELALPGRYAPYDTFVSTASGWALEPQDSAPPAPLFSYSWNSPAGKSVSSVHIPYSSTSDVTWSWDALTSMWKRSYAGTPDMLSDGSQVTASNVIVQTVDVTYGPWFENSQGGVEVQSQLVGSGPVEVLRDGLEVSGTWKRDSPAAKTSLQTTNGNTIALRPGTTWVELVPTTVSVTNSQ